MRKRFSTIMATIWYNSFLQDVRSVENRKVPKLGSVSFHNPMVLNFS